MNETEQDDELVNKQVDMESREERKRERVRGRERRRREREKKRGRGLSLILVHCDFWLGKYRFHQAPLPDSEVCPSCP